MYGGASWGGIPGSMYHVIMVVCYTYIHTVYVDYPK